MAIPPLSRTHLTSEPSEASEGQDEKKKIWPKAASPSSASWVEPSVMAGCLVADLTESEWRNCNHPATIGRVVAISVHRATRLQFPCPGLHSCDTNQRMAAGVCASDAQSLDLSPEAASSRATLTCLGYAKGRG